MSLGVYRNMHCPITQSHLSRPSQLNLTSRQSEIVGRVKEMLRSANMPVSLPVKIDSGQKFECGLIMEAKGVWGGIGSNEPGNRAFLLSMSVLTEMAECNATFDKWMAKIEKMILQEKLNQAAGLNVPTASDGSVADIHRERLLNHRSDEEMCIMNLFDSLRRRNSGASSSVSIPTNLPSQVAQRYEQMLSRTT